MTTWQFLIKGSTPPKTCELISFLRWMTRHLKELQNYFNTTMNNHMTYYGTLLFVFLCRNRLWTDPRDAHYENIGLGAIIMILHMFLMLLSTPTEKPMCMVLEGRDPCATSHVALPHAFWRLGLSDGNSKLAKAHELTGWLFFLPGPTNLFSRALAYVYERVIAKPSNRLQRGELVHESSPRLGAPRSVDSEQTEETVAERCSFSESIKFLVFLKRFSRPSRHR